MKLIQILINNSYIVVEDPLTFNTTNPLPKSLGQNTGKYTWELLSLYLVYVMDRKTENTAIEFHR